jgi:hypothetical protein
MDDGVDAEPQVVSGSCRVAFYCDDVYGISSEGDLFDYVHSKATWRSTSRVA